MLRILNKSFTRNFPNNCVWSESELIDSRSQMVQSDDVVSVANYVLGGKKGHNVLEVLDELDGHAG